MKNKFIVVYSIATFLLFLALIFDKEIGDDCVPEKKQQKGGAVGVSLTALRGMGMYGGKRSRVKRAITRSTEVSKVDFVWPLAATFPSS